MGIEASQLFAGLLIAGSFVAIRILLRWRTGIVILFIWLYLEDVVRRLIPGQPPEVKLVTDGLVFFIYLSLLLAFAVTRAPYVWRPPFVVGLSLLGAMVLVGSLNPHSPGLVFSIFGFRSYLWYVPLAFAGYWMFRDGQDVIRFCRLLAFTSIPLGCLALVQSVFFDIDHPLIRPLEGGVLWHSFSLVEGAGIPFITSVFGSAGRYARVSLLLFLLGLALWHGDRGRTRRGRIVILGALIAAALGVVVSGSRAAIYLLPVGFVWWNMAVRGSMVGWLRSCLRGRLVEAGAALLVALGTVLTIFPDLRVWITYSIPHIYERLFIWMPDDVLSAWRRVPPLGFGTGTFSQGIQYLPGGEEWMELHREATWRSVGDLGQTGFMEAGISKLLYEFGPAGVVIFAVFMVQVILTCRRQVRVQSEPLLRGIAAAVYVFLGLVTVWFLFVHHQVFGDATTLVPLWFFIGVACRLRTLSPGGLTGKVA